MITVLGPLCNLTGYTSAPLSSYCSMFTCQNGLIFSDVKRITSTIDKCNEYQGIFVDKNILYILRIVCVAKKNVQENTTITVNTIISSLDYKHLKGSPSDIYTITD